jgi:rhodanese-related sulfurtransferase
MRHFTPKELHAYLQHESATPPLLLDVREAWEFELCQLPGAQLLPMRNIPSRVNELKRDQEIVVICHHGVRSLQVAYFLEHAGFTEVINLSGGMAAWSRDIDPAMPTY